MISNTPKACTARRAAAASAALDIVVRATLRTDWERADRYAALAQRLAAAPISAFQVPDVKRSASAWFLIGGEDLPRSDAEQYLCLRYGLAAAEVAALLDD